MPVLHAPGDSLGEGSGLEEECNQEQTSAAQPRQGAPIPRQSTAEISGLSLSPDILERYRERIMEAQALLDYGLKRGYDIPDTIIHRINDAEAALYHPSRFDRGIQDQFDTAYRDLPRYIGMTIEELQATLRRDYGPSLAGSSLFAC